MLAVITSSDLQFEDSLLDFGHCTIYESVKKKITMTNMSLLPQPYGFVRTPDVRDFGDSPTSHALQTHTPSVAVHHV